LCWRQRGDRTESRSKDLAVAMANTGAKLASEKKGRAEAADAAAGAAADAAASRSGDTAAHGASTAVDQGAGPPFATRPTAESTPSNHGSPAPLSASTARGRQREAAGVTTAAATAGAATLLKPLAISRVVVDFRRLEELVLPNCGLGPCEAGLIAALLAHWSTPPAAAHAARAAPGAYAASVTPGGGGLTLRVLVLRSNPLGAVGVSALARAMAGLPLLQQPAGNGGGGGEGDDVSLSSSVARCDEAEGGPGLGLDPSLNGRRSLVAKVQEPCLTSYAVLGSS
jgi:hypothetical protein